MRWEDKTLSEATPAEVLGWCKLRTDVFFLEQRITEEEIDAADWDPRTRHIWALDGETTVGYVRVVTTEKPDPRDQSVATSIGRLVVATEYRGSGIARELMRRAIDSAGDSAIVLHAQTYIEDFYASLGFESFGDTFDEAGIPHIRMVRAGRS